MAISCQPAGAVQVVISAQKRAARSAPSGLKESLFQSETRSLSAYKARSRAGVLGGAAAEMRERMSRSMRVIAAAIA
jgi:hypothetical protein